jgi:hypothetical protein
VLAFKSVKADCADSGRGGIFLEAASRAFFCAEIASLRVDLLGVIGACLERAAGALGAAGPQLGFPGSLSRRFFDLASKVAIMLKLVSTERSERTEKDKNGLRFRSFGPKAGKHPVRSAHTLPHARIRIR